MSAEKRYLRFSLWRRLEHWIMVTSFMILAITGLPQKYAESPLSEMILRSLGGIESARIVHRVSATLLMLIGIYHIGTLLYGWLVNRSPLTIFPTLKDLSNAWHLFMHNLGRRKDKPKQGFYTFEEKFEYWALVWGIVIMAITGFFLWNPITAARILPGAWIPAAKAAHGNEALLAVLAIILWHFYHVLIKHFNTSIFSGYMGQTEMESEHPLVLIEEPFPPPNPNNPHFRKRRRWFSVLYGAVSVILLGTVLWFITVEETALAVPDEIMDIAQVQSYSPLDPTPYPTFMPVAAASDIGSTWVGGIGDFFRIRCGTCHRSGGGSAHLDTVTYDGILAGGDSGPAIVPNYPGISLAVIWHIKGYHPGDLTQAEIAAITLWILDGAPED